MYLTSSLTIPNTKNFYYLKEHNFIFKPFMKENCHLFHTPCPPSFRHCDISEFYPSKELKYHCIIQAVLSHFLIPPHFVIPDALCNPSCHTLQSLMHFVIDFTTLSNPTPNTLCNPLLPHLVILQPNTLCNPIFVALCNP